MASKADKVKKGGGGTPIKTYTKTLGTIKRKHKTPTAGPAAKNRQKK